MAIADQLAELNTLRENLATAINGNGVDASTAEGLSSLVQKTGQVVDMLNAVIDRSVKKVYSLTHTTIGDNAFSYCASLTSVNFPAATSIRSNAFSYCTSLTSVYLPAATSIGGSAFRCCNSLTSVYLPAATSIGGYAFYDCASLTNVYLPAVTSIDGYAFRYCGALDTLILRNSSNICTLRDKNALSNTPIALGTGYIYVPAALVDSYKSATNWTTYADQIRAIEDYPEICGGAV